MASTTRSDSLLSPARQALFSHEVREGDSDPVATSSMLDRFGASDVAPVHSFPVEGGSGHRRSTFEPRRRDAVLMWAATGTLGAAAATFLVGVLLVR
ncbi:MAG: hypothetical protein JWR33_794 [Naasia sp.]|jgi:hypothetical protein|uniref:hypothetical protein n=1 Tax=Naasia sp. TaxID=2546198 RepID=UPI0026104569|nr:hypothetical protein [Naasia sp.]MCU1570053.1 hypothetical protein [Naasia sp.]